ncbi:MAG: histidine kinase [Rudaea sp.]|uniref:sensor histidine kinase n=1 Tax=unclassified Rudaea TaxID=2627037 RepID=UPI0014852C51|nr:MULTISPECIES: histidine kinase [unclassified Rudaea]MBN8885017.1 histidine kinase [Rudaea sp.]MBR0344420.1 histidine kinase [Rudaea sp.]
MDLLENSRATLRWNAVAWAAIALFGATQTVLVMHAEGMHHAWGALYLTLLLSWLPWAAATPFVLALGERFRIERPHVATIAVHLAACLAIDVAGAAWIALLERLLDPWMTAPGGAPFLALWIDHLSNNILQSLFLYGAVLAAGYIVRSRRRLAQQQVDAVLMREALTRAQLEALRRQIEPHFLFNALNSAVVLMREGRSEAAVDTLVALSGVLRQLIENSPRQEVALGEELQFLAQYLAIQKTRFADRLQVEIDVPDALLDARVPCLVLQPLIENAIRHGIAARAGAGCVRLTASCADTHLHLSVYNDGPALAQATAPQGVGIANVRTRLQHLYGDAFAFDLRDAPPRGVEAALSLPYRT